MAIEPTACRHHRCGLAQTPCTLWFFHSGVQVLKSPPEYERGSLCCSSVSRQKEMLNWISVQPSDLFQPRDGCDQPCLWRKKGRGSKGDPQQSNTLIVQFRRRCWYNHGEKVYCFERGELAEVVTTEIQRGITSSPVSSTSTQDKLGDNCRRMKITVFQLLAVVTRKRNEQSVDKYPGHYRACRVHTADVARICGKSHHTRNDLVECDRSRGRYLHTCRPMPAETLVTTECEAARHSC